MEIPEIDKTPEPNSSTFGVDAYNFAKWMKEAAPAFNGLRTELLNALNASLLGTTSTSTSSITIASSGTVNFTTGANKGYAIGMPLKIASTANPANYIKVVLNAYNITTGASSGTIISKGGSGTFASWSVFFDVQDPTILSVPTGEAVAAGNLLAIDDGGNSMSVGGITTAVLQAVAATSLHACPLANGNTAIFFTVGTTAIKMMTITRSGTIGLIPTDVIASSAQAGSFVWSAELSNGNIVFVFITSSGEAAFRLINSSGGIVVGPTVIEAGATGQIKCCALTTGGFAVTYNTSTNNRFATYANDGAPNKAPTTNVVGAQTRVAICPTSSGGFVALAGTNSLTGNIYYGLGGTLNTSCAINSPSGSAQADVNIASFSGFVGATGRYSAAIPYGPVISLASDSSSAVVNSYGTTSGSNSILHVPFADPFGVVNTALGNGHIAALANGNFVATFSALGGSSEYPRYAIFNGIGQIVQSGILFSELVKQECPVYAIPKDTNGFSLIWLAANGNIKFAQVKSGNLLGVSLGAVGSTHQYLASGSVALSGSAQNMLNVGESRVTYVRRNAKVVI